MSKANPIEAPEIPPHMLESPSSKAQKKAFAKVKRREAREESKAEEKKSSRKKQSEA